MNADNGLMITETEPPPPEPVAESDDEPSKQEAAVKALPTLEQYMKTYARSCGNNDQKAAKLYAEYEATEKLNRLKREVSQVAQGIVAEATLIRVVGNARCSKFGGFDKWGRMMIGYLNKKN